jgi:hypothetical protein
MTPKALAFRTLVFFLQYSMVASDIVKDRPTLVDSTHRANLVVSSTTSQPYYHTLTSAELGSPSPEAAIGNPLKGLMPSPLFSRPPYGEQLPHALEFYYIGTATTENIPVRRIPPSSNVAALFIPVHDDFPSQD